MAVHPIQVLPDGTRVYSNGTRYTPVPKEKRVYRKRKPVEEGAIRVKGVWFLPLLPGSERGPFPLTRPDTDAWYHAAKPRKCTCQVCQRPQAAMWQDKWWRGVYPPPNA